MRCETLSQRISLHEVTLSLIGARSPKAAGAGVGVVFGEGARSEHLAVS